MDTNERIQYQVCYKGAVELIAAGVIEIETQDWAAEVFAITDLFYDAMQSKTNAGGGTPKQSRPSKTYGGGSKKQASSRTNSSSKYEGSGPKEPNADASDAQRRFLTKLLRENDVGFDNDSFEWEGNDVFFDDLTMGNIQQYIEPLKG